MKDFIYITTVEPLIEAINENYPIEEIYIKSGIKDAKLTKIISMVKDKRIQTINLNAKAFNDRFRNIKNQGIIAICRNNFIIYNRITDFLDEYSDKNKISLLILDGIEDMNNMGAIIRSAYYFGIAGIIVRKDRNAPINETLIRSSAGAIFHLPIIVETNLTETIKKLKDNDFWITGTSSHGGDKLSKLQSYSKIAVVLGNEKKGISRLVSENCDFFIQIDGTGKFESLNVSVSAGIISFHLCQKD